MANIPIQKKRKTAWWIWVVGALAVILLLWLLFDTIDDDDDADVPGPGAAASPAAIVTTSATPATTTGAEVPLTDLSGIATAADPPSLVGRPVQLTGAQVRSVAGDRTFWVGPSADRQVFVVLDETIDPAGAEGLVDINAGQQISLTGTVQALPTLEQARQKFELSEQNSATLDGEQIYLQADKVTVGKP